jgi:hypothetical protein
MWPCIHQATKFRCPSSSTAARKLSLSSSTSSVRKTMGVDCSQSNCKCDRRFSAKLVPTSADRGLHVVSVTNPYGCILGFLDRSRNFFFQVAPQLYSGGWVDPVPNPLLLTKSGSAENRTRNLWICSQELWPLGQRCSHFSQMYHQQSHQCIIFSHRLPPPNPFLPLPLTLYCRTTGTSSLKQQESRYARQDDEW